MITAVVDASVAIKWFVEEPDSPAAKAVLTRYEHFVIPELLYFEAANMLWKQVQRGALDREEAGWVLRNVLQWPFRTQPASFFTEFALELAAETGITAYDAAYLALALKRGLRCYTADKKFFSAIQRTGYRDVIVWFDAPPAYVM